jgi:hypothetical protein
MSLGKEPQPPPRNTPWDAGRRLDVGEGVPLLDDSFDTLTSLSKSEKSNVRLVELLVQKDPIILARTYALALNRLEAAGKTAEDLESPSDAVQAIGAANTVEHLLGWWKDRELRIAPEHAPARDWLSQHMGSLFATMHRVMMFSKVRPRLTPFELQLVGMIDKVSLNMLLSHSNYDTDAALPVLMDAAEKNEHALHQSPGLQAAFDRAGDLARFWEVPPRIAEALKTLSEWHLDKQNVELGTQVILVSELLMAQHTKADYAIPSELPQFCKNYGVLQALVKRKITPVSMAIVY